jgi:hypothetical protein
VVGDFDTIGGATRYGLTFLSVADAPCLAQGPGSTVFIGTNPMDGPEVTHFRITDIQGGNLYLARSLVRVRAGDFITTENGGSGLRFVRDGSSGSISAVSALNETPDGAGQAVTTLLLQGDAASSVLLFSSNGGLTLAGIEGRTYRIEYTEALDPRANWLPLTTITSAGVPQSVPGTRPDTRQKCFYRAVLIP